MPRSSSSKLLTRVLADSSCSAGVDANAWTGRGGVDGARPAENLRPACFATTLCRPRCHCCDCMSRCGKRKDLHSAALCHAPKPTLRSKLGGRPCHLWCLLSSHPPRCFGPRSCSLSPRLRTTKMSLQYSEQTTAERDRTPSYVNSTAPLFIVPLTQITQGQRCTDAAPNIDGIMHGRIGLSTVSTRVTAVLHAPARLRPFGLARAVHGAVISWNEIHQGHHRFEAVLDLSPAGFVVTAAGIFHAVHVGGQPVTSRRAAGAAGKAAPQRSTAARMAMRLTAAAFVSLAIAKAVWMQTIKCCENRRA